MKTSVIRYRVADFLKQYPPFNELSPDELLTLASSGRVVFHESDEYIFRKGKPKGASIWVIQQGSVEIIDETPHGDQLRDLLGEGDMLGAEADAATYRNSAKTTSDVLLYTIDGGQFWHLADIRPRVGRYLAAINDSAGDDRLPTTDVKATGRATWLDIPGPSINSLHGHLLMARSGIRVFEAALRMAQASSDWIAVADEKPLGLVTTRDMRDYVANGAPTDVPLEGLVKSPLVTTTAGLKASNYFLLMTRHRTRAIAITVDGSTQSPLEGVVTDDELSLSTGHNPALLIERTFHSETSDDWRRLIQQAGDMWSSGLANPSNFDLCAQMATEFQSTLFEAVIHRAELELAAEGFSKPPVPHCWLLFGPSGRGETVVPVQPEIGLVFDDSPAGEDSLTYFPGLLERVHVHLGQCGLPVAPQQVFGGDIRPCQALAGWKTTFRSRISDPIGNSVHRNRVLFDFQPLCGDRGLSAALKKSIADELAQSGPFIPVMANDTLSNLPPLTFFHGLVVELDGAQRETLDIQNTALGPIADAARVFALAVGNMEATNTLLRLEQAASTFPTHAALFSEAAQAFRVAAYQLAIASFRGEESVIRPSLLGRYDQRLLKNAFDAIQRLLEVSSTVFDAVA